MSFIAPLLVIGLALLLLLSTYGVGNVIGSSIVLIFMLLVLSIFPQLIYRVFTGKSAAKDTALKATPRPFLLWVIALKIEDHFGHTVIDGAVVSMLIGTCFLVQTVIYSKVLTKPEAGVVSFRNVCMISFIRSIFSVVVLWSFLGQYGHAYDYRLPVLMQGM
jgi:hypothetical protein